MPEPKNLKRGKEFQKIVQTDFTNDTKFGIKQPEKYVRFDNMNKIRQKSGRADIFIQDTGGFLVIYEIKSTDWDKIKPSNIKRNLYKHQKQLFMYVDKYFIIDDLWANLAIIYPSPPKKEGLREFIENYLQGKYGVPPYWYTEINDDFKLFMIDK